MDQVGHGYPPTSNRITASTASPIATPTSAIRATVLRKQASAFIVADHTDSRAAWAPRSR